jgi:multiple sugar transport system permease protein
MENTTKMVSSRQELLPRRKTSLNGMKKAIIYLLLIGMSMVFIAPFVWTISASLKTNARAFQYPPQWIPDKPWLWQNYPEGLAAMKFPQRLFYSVFYTLTATFGTVLSSSLVAFGFARCHFKGRDILFRVLLSTMMLPALVTLIPSFLIFQKLGLIDSYAPLILPTFFGSAFNIFLLRQFYLTLPTELDDAAIIDGCNPLGIWWYITIPLSKSALATITILSLMTTWGDFLGPVVYLSNDSIYPLSIGITALIAPLYVPNWPYIMACSVVIALPPLLLFFIGQRYILQSVTMTGLKG